MRSSATSPIRRPIMRLGLAIVLAAAGISILPATAAFAATNLTVSTTADIASNAGACGNTGITVPPSPLSLREATCLANNVGGAVNINIPSGTYNLANGELAPGTQAGQNVSLVGAGAASTIINAGGNSRVIDLDRNLVGGVTATISGLTITGGADSTFGGAGIIGGSNNNTTADSLTLSGVIVTGNAANGATPAATNKPGGGVQFLGGQLTIINSTISNNSSASSYGSGVAYLANGLAAPEGLTISNTTFSGNTNTNTNAGAVGQVGGALSVDGPSTFSVSASRFVNNSVTSTAGTVSPVGAAIQQQSGTLTVTGSNFTGNSVAGEGGTPAGGAVEVNAGTATLHYNRFVGNIATAGSAVHVTAGTVDATSNWWGCNAGPGSAGCDTVSGGPTVSPRLVLTASASPATVTGPNATSTISANLTTDSLGAAVSGANLTAFGALPATFSDPPGDATVTVAPGAHTAGFSAGAAAIDYHSNTTVGPNPVNVTFDNATVATSVTINEAPIITSANHAAFNVGAAGSFTVTATGAPTPAITETGTLPAGLSFTDNGDGTATLAGTATGPGGTFPLSLTANNGVNPNATQTFTISVGQPPAFTSPATATFQTGAAGSFTVTTSGIPTVSVITQTGTLPTGLSFTDNGDGTATVAGTPGAGTGGTYPVSLGATNGVAPNGSQTLTVQVNQALAITTNPSTQTVNPGTSVTFSAAASGVPTPTVQWQRSTNGGASFTNIAGATSTSYTFTAAAGDNGNMYRAVFTNVVTTATTTAATLNVGTAPAFTSSNVSTFAVGSAGNFAITTSGVPSATLSRTGTFPPWLTLTDNGDGTGTLTGTPPAGSGGSYTFTLKAANGFSPSASQPFTLFVNESPTITSADHATFVVGAAGAFTVSTTGGYPQNIGLSKTGTLPSGVSFVDNGDGTATLAGTPTAGTAGTYPITVSATATGGTTTPSAQSFTLTVNGPPIISSADHATFSAGANGSFTVTTSAGQPTATTLTKTGTLPAGVSFVDQDDGTALLSGTPAFNSGGTYALIIKASNGVAPDTTQAFTLTVNEPPTITSADHTVFTVGVAAGFTVTTAPGQPTATVLTTVTADLPPGITFVDNGDGTATIGGVPTAGGVYPFVVTASNGVLPDRTQTFTATVNQPPSITSADHTTFGVGINGSFTVTTTPGTPADTTLAVIGALPTGVAFVDNGDGTATLHGTAAAGQGGSYPITITAANGVVPSPTQAFTLTVLELPAVTSAAAATFSVGTAASFTITTDAGYPNATGITQTGALPAGISFTDNGDGTATLAGTPATGSGGSYPLVITTTSTAGHDDQAFTLTVNESPLITSTDNATFIAGTAATFTVTTAGGFPTPPALTASGTLPDGITFTDNGDGTATLAGTSLVGGVYPLTVSASNGASTADTQSFTLTVNGPPSLTSAAAMTFTAGVPGTFTITARAGVPDTSTLTESGTLPDGITFTDNGDGTATLAGTAPVTAIGNYQLAITASNGTAPDTIQHFALTITGAQTLTLPPALPASDGALTGVPPRTTVGAVLHLSGTGYAAGAPIVVGIYSAPTVLGHATADDDGTFSLDVTVPNKLGRHMFVAAGIGADGQPSYLQAGTIIVAAPVAAGDGSGTVPVDTTGAGLADTGTNLRGALQGGVGLVLVGLFLLAGTRRNRLRMRRR
ncbi:MAG: hypothetical protein JWN95_3974 [Frankiales bacterium]|nr:hypothetical protein [Frankiales bacterium]